VGLCSWGVDPLRHSLATDGRRFKGSVDRPPVKGNCISSPIAGGLVADR